MMNLFRLLGKMVHRILPLALILIGNTGDLSHLVSIFILLQKMKSSNVSLVQCVLPRISTNHFPQSAAGISFKSQFLYLVVYVTRYLGTTLPPPLQAHFN